MKQFDFVNERNGNLFQSLPRNNDAPTRIFFSRIGIRNIGSKSVNKLFFLRFLIRNLGIKF